MKSQVLLSMLIHLLLFSSCKKDSKSGNPENMKGERLKTVQWTSGGSGTYTYDDQKRQIREEQNTGITTEFIYNPGKITRLVKQSSTTDSFKYTLNAEGYVKTVLTPDGITYTYEYTPKGMIAKQMSNDPSPFVATYYYNSTGLTDSIRQTVGGIWISTATYTYYPDKLNSLKNENLGLVSYGEDFLRPIRRYRSLYKSGNTIKEQVTDFTYTFDSKGRIASKSFVNAGQPITYNYTYY